MGIEGPGTIHLEGQAGQLLDLTLVDGGLGGEVELLQGSGEGEVSQLGTGGEVAFPASGHFSTAPDHWPTCTVAPTHFQWTPHRDPSQLT